ncbi:MAG: hypothetical protein M3Z64_00060 [Verrucomicrobiota bacterium]|nr:hypothetical protein [Verrucomicrobiota bacterium]
MADRTPNVPWIIAGAMFAFGLLIGVLIGRSFSSAHQRDASTRGAVEKSDSVAAHHQAAADAGRDEATKLVLGDLTTIPFQELYGVLSSRPPIELPELAQQLNALPAGHEKDQKIGKFFKAWAHFDPNGALKSAAAVDTPASRQKAIASVVEGADSTAAESLAKAISGLPPDALPPNTQRGLVGQAVNKWSEINGAAAAAFIDTMPAIPGSFFADLHGIAMNWAATDPQAALAWAQQRDATSVYPSHFATSGAIAGWWQKDAAAAEAYVMNHLTTPSERQLASSLVSQIYNSDPKHATEWVNQLPDLETRRQADSMLAHQIGVGDPKGAAEWAVGLPEDVRSGALSSAMNLWAQNNPAAAAEWLGSLNGAARDQAVSGYTSGIANRDPANALNWATTISDARTRDSSVDRIVRMWMQRSPSDATAWVQQSALSDEQKKRLVPTVVSAPPPGG